MFKLTRKEMEEIKETTKRAMEQEKRLNVEDLVISRLPDKLVEEKEMEVRIVIYDTVWGS